MYFLGVFQNIGDTIEQALRTFMGQIAAILYSLIESMYVLFSYLAKAEIIDNDFIAAIYRKVGLLLGLFMVFKLSFSLIQSLINPEKLTDKKNGFASIIGRCILSIVLLGITPSLFREAFHIQNYIVGSNNQNNIIYKLVVGKAVSGNFEDLGRVLASDLYFTFFTDDDGNLNKGIKDIITDNDFEYYDRFKTDNYDNLVESVENKEMSFHDTVQYLTVKENGKYVIEFNWLLSLSFGIVFIYLMFSYCIQTAVRVIQLAYLQLIAPVPILSYISDPDGAFKKWLKQCSTTFLDLFIRLSIIYFSMYVIDDVIEQFSKSSGIIFESTGVAANDTLFKALIKIFIILGLLIFAKRVPELLKDLFPNMGGGTASLSFGLKSPKKMLDDIPLIGGAANKVLGYAGNLGKNVGKWAWNQTGGRGVNKIKRGIDRWGDNRKNAREIKELEKPGKRLYDKYGSDNIADAFKNDEYRNSYLNLKNAKDENRNAEEAYELAKASGDSNALSAAIQRKNAAAKALSDAQKRHDNMRKRYGADARREDAFSMYKSMHPDKFLNNSNNNTRNRLSNNNSSNNNNNTQNRLNNNMSTTTASSPARQNNQSVFGNISNGSDDGNPYENGHGQFTADSISESVNNDNPYENPNYYNDNGNFRNSSNSNPEDDNPYTNPNYYNDNNQASNNNNNDDDEFDGSNYY